MGEWGQEGWVAGVGDGGGRSGGDGRFKPRFTWQKKKKSNQLKNHQSNQETASPPGRKRGRNQNSKWGFQGEGWVGRDRRGERGENSNSEVIWLKR